MTANPSLRPDGVELASTSSSGTDSSTAAPLDVTPVDAELVASRWHLVRARLRLAPRRPTVLGALGTLALAIGGVGAGAVPIQDPMLDGTLLGAVRYGHGRMLATTLAFAGLALLIYAWLLLGRMVKAHRVGGYGVLIATTAWVLPLVAAPPLFSRDVYSYLAQGAVALHGFDPYSVGATAIPPDVVTDNVSSSWTSTPAPYGPLFILLAKGVVMITGDNVVLGAIMMRLAMLIGFGLLVWAIPGLVRHLGGRASTALWVVAANPLMIAMVIGGAHNDLLMVGLLAAGVLLVLDRRHLGGFAVLTLAVAVKATAALALPFLLWVWVARLPGPARVRFAKATAAALVTFCAVFAACTLAAGVDLGWIDTLRTQLSLSTWMSVPNLISDFSYHLIGVFFASATPAGFAGVLRPAALVVLAGLLAVLWWRARDGGRGAIRYAAIALLAGAALGPSVLPWYYVWPLALAAAFALRDRWLVAVAGLSIWMVAMTNPDGTIIARWPWGASAWLTWCYIAAASVGAVFVARTLNRPLPPTALVESGSTPAAVDDHAVA